MIYDELANQLVRYQYVLFRAPKLKEKSTMGALFGEKKVIGYLIEIQDGVCPRKLCDFMGVSTARIASILNKLEEKGLIIRTPNSFDKRKVIVNITKKGRAFGETGKKNVVKDLSSLLEKLGEDDAKEYVRIMKKIYNLSVNDDTHITK